VVFANYEKSWEPVHPLKCEYVRSEVNTQFAAIAGQADMVVCSSFNVDLGNGSGSIHVCLPYAMLEPIRDLIYGTVQGENTEPDRRWVGLLSQEVQNASVRVVARLAQARMSVGDIVGMRKGDVVPIDIGESVIADVDGVPMFACEVGQSRNHYAIKIQHVLGALGTQRKGESE
jgi:flagellar motor switch protein FliM